VLQKSALIGAKNLGRVMRVDELHGLGDRFAILLEYRPVSVCLFGIERARNFTVARDTPPWSSILGDANEAAAVGMIGRMS
jgi:hypothetical protein